MNMQYTIKTEDIQNKGEGKGQMDSAVSELMAISTQTSTIFACQKQHDLNPSAHAQKTFC